MKSFLLFFLLISPAAFAGTIYPVGGAGVNCASGTNGQVYTTNGSTCSFTTVAGTGTVVGPVSSTDTAIATYSGTGGQTLLNNSGATISAGVITASGFSTTGTSTLNKVKVTGATVSTTDATVTTIETISPGSNNTSFIESSVVGKRTGGTSGATNDSAALVRKAMCKNIAGTASIVNLFDDFTARDQAAWEMVITASGANCLVQVNGSANNNVSWTSSTRTVTQ